MTKHEPCFENLLRVLRREGTDRPVLFEFFLNERLHRRLLGARYQTETGAAAQARNGIAAFAEAGYDYATFLGGWLFQFARKPRAQAETVSLNDGAVITDRASFDAFSWPEIETADFSLLKDIGRDLPRGMRFMVCTPDGLLENVIGLLGYERLCMLLADDARLVGDVFQRVGETLLSFYRKALGYRSVGLVMVNDDWGFKTQPLLSPSDMRTYVFPWHRRIVEAAHAAGRPAVLHSCGQLESLMEDIILDMKYDGKHSFEDAICPVEQAYRKWGGRMAILGGLDIDFVVRSSPKAIHERARRMLALAPTGYALGTGNSVPEYVPDDHYFAMTRAALDPNPSGPADPFRGHGN
jgi:uroporphyrinogen decarboxylase